MLDVDETTLLVLQPLDKLRREAYFFVYMPALPSKVIPFLHSAF